MHGKFTFKNLEPRIIPEISNIVRFKSDSPTMVISGNCLDNDYVKVGIYILLVSRQNQ